MDFFSDLFRQLPLYLLSLPVVLVALSVHESAHGYVAYKLGDPTARNLGRITLNPVKHFDVIGFLCMVLLHFGWAKPVPIITRNFKKPRRDMAITGAAGPISNLLLALIHLIVLRIVMIFVIKQFSGDVVAFWMNDSFTASPAFIATALIVYILYMGVVMNVVLAIFNLIPIPPFDGSRIFYVFLPNKWYFGIMKYERYIMIGFFALLLIVNRLPNAYNPLYIIETYVIEGLLKLFGFGPNTDGGLVLTTMQYYLYRLVGLV